ncbi:MAG: exodeoxyribonuclease VII large subunit [Candidatus Marinimicrobia bacterium]|jgi:exodeoxyribonuclease VII large subunit|nr:exodeoxyribonuclease VII large subunit [Candidatus Neomarinimicrobiota bacterium]
MEQTILSITQINNQVKYALENKYSNLWIQGEIASCNAYPSGHVYLTLKDPQSELSAVIFSQYIQRLSCAPAKGMEVTVNGDLSLYTPRGQYQLQIKSLYPKGQGELYLAYEALKKKLAEEGLFDASRKKSLPVHPRRIGIITSSEGAALRDIIQVLGRRAPHISVLLYPVPVQGAEAGDNIAAAIASMNRYNQADILIVGRGGGSMEDLWAFNEERVVRAIADSRLPVISAVGHETDTTLADFAADLRAPTPSAAAELAAVSREELLQYLDSIQEKMESNLHTFIRHRQTQLDHLQNRHGFYKSDFLLKQWAEKLTHLSQSLEAGTCNKLEVASQKLHQCKEHLQLLNPAGILQRGYAIATDKQGDILLSPQQVEKGDEIHIQIAKGDIHSKVLKKEIKDHAL